MVLLAIAEPALDRHLGVPVLPQTCYMTRVYASVMPPSAFPCHAATCATVQVVVRTWESLLASDFIKQHPRHGSGVHDLHTSLLRAIGAPVATLTAAAAAQAAALRKGGCLATAMHHHLELHALLGAVAAVEEPGADGSPHTAAVAAWRLEEAKLLWASGRQQLAVKLVEELQGDLDCVAAGAAACP